MTPLWWVLWQHLWRFEEPFDMHHHILHLPASRVALMLFAVGWRDTDHPCELMRRWFRSSNGENALLASVQTSW
jgi:hypothetical protein